MKKIKCFIDKNKEELFLNEMAAEGYALTEIKGFEGGSIPVGLYCFGSCEPSEYVYHIALKYAETDEEVWQYAWELEESGAEVIQVKDCWIYLRLKKDSEVIPGNTPPEEEMEFYSDKYDGYISGALLFLVAAGCWVSVYIKKAGPEPMIIAATCVLVGAVSGTAFIAALKCKSKLKDIKKQIGG